jgi:sugar phosphate isomerase/epimerase
VTASNVTFSVFTKPWRLSLPELGEHIRKLGFEAIELPVRPGYPVAPETVKELPRAARQLGEFGVKIASIAGPTDEATMAACAEAGIPIIRICVGIGRDERYTEAEGRLRREFDELVPQLSHTGVTLGVQNHSGHSVSNALGLRAILSGYDPRHVAAVWDAAHNALNGEPLDFALDIVWPHLCMVNLKNAYWRRRNGPEAEVAEWQTYWTSGRQGLASWPKVAADLKRRGYQGVVCLPAEYTDEAAVDRLIVEDLAFARALFEDTKINA